MGDLPVDYYKRQLNELNNKRYWTPFNFREYVFLRDKIKSLEKEEG